MNLIPQKLRLSKARCKRILWSLAFCTASLGLTLVIDILLAKTNYSLAMLYLTTSAVICLRSTAPSCHFKATIPTPPTARYKTTGMVVNEQHEATQAGITLLNQGGNAIDAAVGVGYALAVTYSCCGNLGGGGFMLIRFANGRTRFLDFREMAPGAATPNMYLDAQGQVIPRLRNQGYLAVGVLGTVKGLDYALKTYGTRSRQQVIAVAITLAERGFTLQAADAALLQDTKTFRTQPNVVSIFLKDGQPYQSSDWLVQSNLARSLHLLSKSYIVLAEPYALTNKVFQQLWRMGYRVVGFLNWGAAESIAINPTTKTIYGLHDSRKRTGSAIAQKSCSGSRSWQCN